MRNEPGNSILHILAVEGKHELLLQPLKCRGASPDMKNKDMDTALSLAVSSGYFLVVEALLIGLTLTQILQTTWAEPYYILLL